MVNTENNYSCSLTHPDLAAAVLLGIVLVVLSTFSEQRNNYNWQMRSPAGAMFKLPKNIL